MDELLPSEEEENKRLYEELRSLFSQTVRRRYLTLCTKEFTVDHDTDWANGNVRIVLSEYENEDTTLYQLKESCRLDTFIDHLSSKLCSWREALTARADSSTSQRSICKR